MAERRAGDVIYLGLALLTTVMAALLAARLALSVAATPADLWFDEFTPMTTRGDPGGSAGIARAAAAIIVDPSAIRTLLSDCEPAGAPGKTCLDLVDEGLAAVPVSGELWLERSRLLARMGEFGGAMTDALATSFAVAPNEGWLAATRLVFALQVRPFLPDEMMDDIGHDIGIVATNRATAVPLIDAYIADPLFRQATWDVIERYATYDQQEALIGWIRGAI